MLSHTLFTGVYPALLTPFTATDTIDWDLFKKNTEAQLAAGVHGLIVGGSLGEASTITRQELLDLASFLKNEMKVPVPVILNIAEQATREAVALAKEAENIKVDGLMVLPPMRYKADDEETTQYYLTIAKATSLPILLYNNPVDYKIEITLPMFEKLAAAPNILAVKESTRDVTNVTRLKNAFGDRFKIMCGVDTLAYEELLLGADGLIAGLVDAFPAETVVMYNAIKEGNLQKALAIYRWFIPLLELDIHPKLVQNIKLAATYTGIGSEYVREPRLPLQGAERERVKAIIEKALANKPSL